MRPVSLAVAQQNFDDMVVKLGVSASAPAGDKIAALRSMTPEELNALHGGGVSSIIWDPHFWPDRDEASWLEDQTPFPSWLKGAVIGSTKEETALFLLNSITGTEAVSLIKAATAEKNADFVNHLLTTYDIRSDPTPGSGNDALIRLLTHSIFTVVAQGVASQHAELPVSLYSFDQVDPFETSRWKGRAYHSLGNAMLFRQPTVAGVTADAGTRATANRFCEAAIALTHGDQPWEPYRAGQKVMVFNGEKSGLVHTGGKAPWSEITKTKEQWDMFKAVGVPVIRGAIHRANSGAST
jgi:hypothetical protein